VPNLLLVQCAAALLCTTGITQVSQDAILTCLPLLPLPLCTEFPLPLFLSATSRSPRSGSALVTPCYDACPLDTRWRVVSERCRRV